MVTAVIYVFITQVNPLSPKKKRNTDVSAINHSTVLKIGREIVMAVFFQIVLSIARNAEKIKVGTIAGHVKIIRLV